MPTTSGSVYVLKKAPLGGAGLFDSSTNAGYCIGVDDATSSRPQIRRVADRGGTPTLSADLTLDVG